MDSRLPSMIWGDWGAAGARHLGKHADLLLVVDILSFSTCVDVAVARGASVYPHPYHDHRRATEFARHIGGEVAGPRGDRRYAHSLSPHSLCGIEAGTRLVLPSPNGSAVSAALPDVPVIAVSLRNLDAVAAFVQAHAPNRHIAVIAAGEHWPDGTLRPAIEDVLGAGAIMDAIDCPCSPEAEVMRNAFRSSRTRLDDLVRGSMSGLELAGKGYANDGEVALQVNASNAVPLKQGGAGTPFVEQNLIEAKLP